MLQLLALLPQIFFGNINAFTIMPPLDQIYHPVSTDNSEAQKNFDLGLRNIYAFNHDLAYEAFEKAAEIDPELAMAYWGMALALGQNVNSDVTKEREQKAFEFMQKALSLAPKASKNEQAYIKALATRYTDIPDTDLTPFRFFYRDAMKKLVLEYPEDLDAAALYAESILDLNPWKWWSLDGKPEEGTIEAVNLLNSILLRNPYHIGANHYFIHALEESPFPERALSSAYRLETLLENAGHLLHMPCHIFMLLGYYDEAIATSKKAIKADKDYGEFYWKEGSYPIHYLSHNFYVLTRAYMLYQDYENAIQTANELIAFLEPYFEGMSETAHFAYVPLEVYLYFHKWQEIIDYKIPAQYPIAQAYDHLSKALAYASLGNTDAAKQEKLLMLHLKKTIPETLSVAQNPFQKILALGTLLIDAKLAEIEGNFKQKLTLLKQAVIMQDSFDYDEPPAWFMPVRQLLGEALLEDQRFIEAETEFKKALKKLQRNAPLLQGLSQSLKGQRRFLDAYWVEREAFHSHLNVK